MYFKRFVTILLVLGGWSHKTVLTFEVRRHDHQRKCPPFIACTRFPSTILTATARQSQDDTNTRHTSTSSSSSTTSGITTHLPKLIVTCGTTDELIKAIDAYVQSHHVVAEIGSQLRQVSTRLCEKCHSATLVDVQRKFPKSQSHRTEAMRLQVPSQSFCCEKSTFYEIGQLSDWPQVLFPNSKNSENNDTRKGYDMLVLDVNAIIGNDLEWTSLQIIQQFHSLNLLCRNNNNDNNNDLIVLVKSSGLNHWANHIHSVHYWNDHSHELMSMGGGRESGTTNAMSSWIVATVGVQEYRSTIPTTVRSTDCVLEIGCHYGTTTALLQQHAADVIGVDVGPKIIAQAKQRFPQVHFRVGNAWKTGELLRFLQDYQQQATMSQNQAKLPPMIGGYNVVYVDVGGLSGSDGLLEAIQLTSSLSYALEPRCIVIKSLCMQRLSTSLVSFWHLQRQKRKQMENASMDK